MAGTFALELLTPQAASSSVEVTEAILPGQLGELTILPDHAPYLAQLQPGVLRYQTASGEDAVVIASGFVEMTNNKLLVLTRSVLHAEGMDAATIKNDLEQAVRRLDGMDAGDPQYPAAGEDVQILRASLALLKK